MTDRDFLMLLDSLQESLDSARESGDRDAIETLETQYRIVVACLRRLQSS